MKNIIKIHKKELNNSITEIRIEEIRDVDSSNRTGISIVF